jgi:hypothetical protein
MRDDRDYRRVALYADGRQSTRRVHWLMMLAFIGPQPAGMHTRHLDDDRSHNVLSNLAYGTPGENQLDRVRMGNHPTAARSTCGAGDHKGARVCVPCRRKYARLYARRRRAQLRQEIAA